MKTVFIRAIEESDKAATLRGAIHNPDQYSGMTRFERRSSDFASIPQAPFAYRVPSTMLALAGGGRTLTALGAAARQGFGASVRFHRLAWEVNPAEIGPNKPWLWLAHGTPPRPFFKPTYHVVLWSRSGREAKAEVLARYPYLKGNYGFKIQAEEFYGRAGLCYGKRTGAFTAQTMPEGHAFSFEGTAIHTSGSIEERWILLGLLNSKPVSFWLNELCAQHKTYTYVNSVPIPQTIDTAIGALAVEGWRCQRDLSRYDEVGNHFALPALLGAPGETLHHRTSAWSARAMTIVAQLDVIQDEIDERCYVMYGIDDADRRAIAAGFGESGGEAELPPTEANGGADVEDAVELVDEEPTAVADTTNLVAELLSWCIGVAFGRFDVRLATGERAPPAEPDPFDPLPVCSPGMLTGEDGLPLTRRPVGYPLSFPNDGILVHDPGHPRDLIAATRAVFELVFGVSADEMWQEAATILDPRDHDMPRWLESAFFEHHLRRYSKGRRRAPILWQLGIPSGRYRVWCYAHRMTRDTMLTIQNDVVVSKLAHEERRLSSLVTEAGHTPSAHNRAEIANQDSLVAELRMMLEEIRRVAPLWNPDLDDGIVLVMAPLWRLMPTHKAWQREIAAKWDELVAGKYDWAHIAMHLWPERVILKCATDRSLAIAHDLEEVFWTTGPDEKWVRRSTPTRPINDLIAERTSPAVKVALASLLEAPPLNSGSGRRRRTGK